MQEFNVSQTKAILSLSLYVLAYGIGVSTSRTRQVGLLRADLPSAHQPMIFSPLSEIPSFGRLNVYMVTFFIFMILQIPTGARSWSWLFARFLSDPSRIFQLWRRITAHSWPCASLLVSSARQPCPLEVPRSVTSSSR